MKTITDCQAFRLFFLFSFFTERDCDGRSDDSNVGTIGDGSRSDDGGDGSGYGMVMMLMQ